MSDSVTVVSVTSLLASVYCLCATFCAALRSFSNVFSSMQMSQVLVQVEISLKAAIAAPVPFGQFSFLLSSFLSLFDCLKT